MNRRIEQSRRVVDPSSVLYTIFFLINKKTCVRFYLLPRICVCSFYISYIFFIYYLICVYNFIIFKLIEVSRAVYRCVIILIKYKYKLTKLIIYATK